MTRKTVKPVTWECGTRKLVRWRREHPQPTRDVSLCGEEGNLLCSLYERDLNRISTPRIVQAMGRRPAFREMPEHTLRRLMYGTLRLHGVLPRHSRKTLTPEQEHAVLERHLRYFPDCPLGSSSQERGTHAH
jgi:hypothetical protein